MDAVEQARRTLVEIRKPGCTLWACQLAELIERLVRRIDELERPAAGTLWDRGKR
jgi:hypothetical protein